MRRLLGSEHALTYWVTDTFSEEMLDPILKNKADKAETDWDDYDEVAHCRHLIQAVRERPAITMEFHTLARGQQVLGVGLVSRGALEKNLYFPAGYTPADPMDAILVFNYFHIAPQGRGNGTHWLRDIILPSYQGRGYRACYVKSSHPRAFSLYGRLGRQVWEYSGKSDHNLYVRQGKLFRIPLA